MIDILVSFSGITVLLVGAVLAIAVVVAHQ